MQLKLIFKFVKTRLFKKMEIRSLFSYFKGGYETGKNICLLEKFDFYKILLGQVSDFSS